MGTSRIATNETKHRLRVAHVGAFAPESASGIHKTIAGLVNHLPAHGVDVEVWTFSSRFAEPRRTPLHDFDVLELPSRYGPWRPFGLPAASRHEIETRAQDVDLVHFHSVFVPENVFAAGLLNVPYVITPNGGYNERVVRGRNRLLKRTWLSLFERSYIRRAASLHAVSSSEATDLSHLVGKDRVVEIPNALDESCFARPVKEPPGRNLLFLGRLATDHKGLDLLLRGFAHSTEVASEGSRLFLAGPDFRGGKNQLANLAKRLAIGNRVQIMDPRFGQAKWALIESCYGFVHTSRWEGLPFSVLEALAVGRPVIVTPETNLAHLVGQYRSGFVVDATPESIAEGIDALLRASPNEYRSMQERARALARENFVWKNSAHAIAQLYRSLTERRRSSGGSRQFLPLP